MSENEAKSPVKPKSIGTDRQLTAGNTNAGLLAPGEKLPTEEALKRRSEEAD